MFTKLMNAGYLASLELARSGKLEVPARCSLGTSAAIILMGDVAQWFNACVTEGAQAFSTRELYLHHMHWCMGRGETPVSSSTFEKMVRRLMEDLGREPSHSIVRNGSHCNGYRALEVQS